MARAGMLPRPLTPAFASLRSSLFPFCERGEGTGTFTARASFTGGAGGTRA